MIFRNYEKMGPGLTLAMMVFILWTLTNISYYYDNKSSALPLEVTRCLVSGVMYQVLSSAGWSLELLSPPMFMIWMGSSLVVSILLSMEGNTVKAKQN